MNKNICGNPQVLSQMSEKSKTQRRVTMKKLIIVCLVLLVLGSTVFFVGCKKK